MKRVLCAFLALLMLLPAVSFCFSASAEDDGQASGLDIKAKTAVLMDSSTGKVLWSKNEHTSVYPASVTKIMPLLLFMEAIDSGKISVDDKVTCSPEAAAKGGSQIWLRDGETMTVDELLRAVAISSANDACCALGEYIAGSESAFVDMMNKRAKELKMENTHFDNCSGLDDDTDTHKSSAYDIALMAKELLKHETIQKYSTVWMDSLRDGQTQLVNTNKLVRFYKGTTGLKTGTTAKAGKCLCASAKRDYLHLIAVVMGCETGDDRFASARALLDYGFANYETAELKFDKSLLSDVDVIKGAERSITAEFMPAQKVTLKKGESEKIVTQIKIASEVEAPVEEKQVLGAVEFKLGDELIGRTQLYAPHRVERLRFTDILLMLFKSLANEKASVRNVPETESELNEEKSE